MLIALLWLVLLLLSFDLCLPLLLLPYMIWLLGVLLLGAWFDGNLRAAGV